MESDFRMRSCNVEKMACRYCEHAQVGHIRWGFCEQYPKYKPEKVYFENKECPKFKRGVDLLPYEY